MEVANHLAAVMETVAMLAMRAVVMETVLFATRMHGPATNDFDYCSSTTVSIDGVTVYRKCIKVAPPIYWW